MNFRALGFLRRKRVVWICAVCVTALFLSTCCLLVSLHDGGELLHDVLARGHLALDEMRHKLRTSGWFGTRCSVSEPVFFATVDGGLNAAVELAMGCPRDAFVVLQRAAIPQAGGSAELLLRIKRRDAAPAWGAPAGSRSGAMKTPSTDSESQHRDVVIESLAVAATSVRTVRQKAPAQHLQGLHVAHISPSELCEAADCEDHYRRARADGSDDRAVPVAYFRVAAVVMRSLKPTDPGSEVQHIEVLASRPVLLRVPVPFAADTPAQTPRRLRPIHGTAAEVETRLGPVKAADSADVAAESRVRGAAAPFRLKLGLVSDSQSGARTFRHVLGHMVLSARAGSSEVAAKPGLRKDSGKQKLRRDKSHDEPIYGARLDVHDEAGDGAPLDLLLHGGDTQQSPQDRREAFLYLLGPLADLYTAGGPTGTGDGLGYALPTLLVRGNHDDEARHRAYTLPPTLWDAAAHSEAAAGAAPLYYELQWGSSLRVILLDSDDETDAQVQWLRSTCETTSSNAAEFGEVYPLRLALAHIPPFVEYWEQSAWQAGESRWSDYTRFKLLPELQSCKQAPVHMLVSGHSHLYQRGKLSAGKASLLLATIGGGGGALEASETNGGKVDDAHVFDVTALENHFVLADIKRQAGSEAWMLRWRALGDSGDVIDILNLTP